MTEHKNPCKEIQLPQTKGVKVLTLPRLSQLVRETWPEYGDFRAASYFKWPSVGMYLYPNVTPALRPEGVTEPVHLLQALVAKGKLEAGSYAILTQGRDFDEPPEVPDQTDGSEADVPGA